MSEMLLTAYNGAILGPIAKFLGWIMNGMYILMEKIGISNVGLSIILFTIVIYMLLFPLTYKQQKFSKLSQKMNPELQAVQKKYKDKKDPTSMQNMQTETQMIYEKYGVSPAGSCGQMLIQFPLLLALYRVFMNVPAYISSVKQVYMGLVDNIMATSGYQDTMAQLVTDLNLRTVAVDFTATDTTTLQNYIVDVLYKMNSSGWDALKSAFPGLTDSISSTYGVVSHVNQFLTLNISDTPLEIIKSGFANHSYLIAVLALLIPVISYLTQVLSIKLMPTASGSDNDQMAQQMKMMNRTMPLFSLVMCFTVPVGLGIYWIASAVVRSIQQFVLNKHFDKIDLDDIIAKNQEKAKKRREKMGISENQITNAARMNTRQVSAPSPKSSVKTTAEKELEAEKAAAKKANARPDSMAAKANLVRDFNERNNKKNENQIEYEVVDKGSAGFLGIARRDAVIKVRKKYTVEGSIREFLEKIFAAMELKVEILITQNEDDNTYNVELKGDDMGILIGKRGQTLDSLQYLTNLAVNKQSEEYIKVKIDTEDYRKRRKETLENLAKNIAYKVKRTKRPVSLEPMNPFERRVIHSALQNDKFVTTHSEGDEPYRHVVVTLKRDRDR